MKTLLSFLLFSFLLTATSLAIGSGCNEPDSLPINNQSTDSAGQACCSSHHGVCGCSFGTITCCDGTASPSCTCDNPVEENIFSTDEICPAPGGKIAW